MYRKIVVYLMTSFMSVLLAFNFSSAQVVSPIPQPQELKKESKPQEPVKPKKSEPVKQAKPKESKSLEQAQPMKDTAIAAKKSGPTKIDKPALSPQCRALMDNTHQELTRIKNGISEMKGQISQMKAANKEMVNNQKAYKKAQAAKKRTSGVQNVEVSGEYGTAPGATAGSIPSPAELGAQTAVKQIQDKNQTVNLQLRGASQDLARAQGQVEQMRGCAPIPSNKIHQLQNDVKSIRSQAKGQASSVRQISGGSGSWTDCAKRGSGAGNCASASECYSCCAAFTDRWDKDPCELSCKRLQFACEFDKFDDKANQLFNILSEILKQQKEMQGSVVRKMN